MHARWCGGGHGAPPLNRSTRKPRQRSCFALTSRKLQLKRLQKRQLNVPNERLRSSCITLIKHVHLKACAVMRSKFCQQKILNPQNCLDKGRSTNCGQEPLECNFFYCFSNNICRLYMFILLVIVFMLLFSVLFEPVVFDILNAKYRRIINKSTFCVCVLNQAVLHFMATRCRPYIAKKIVLI